MLVELNPEQLAAASHGDGPLLIVAGAGTGKTATLVHRVAHLIAQRRRPAAHPAAHLHAPRRRRDAAPRRRAPAAAARGDGRRLRARLGRHLPRHRRAPAAHPRARHRHGARLHHPRPRRLRRPAARRAHRARARPRRRAVPAEVHLPRHLLALRQRPAAAARGAARVLSLVRAGRGGPRRSSSPRYTDAKEEQQVLDYDDLLLFWRGLLADPAAGARVRERFDHVLVDEYQDTNALQADIVSLLRPGRQRRHLRGRRRPGHLRLPRRHRAQHPRLRAALPRRRVSRSRATTAPRRPSWRPPTPSSPRPPSAATRSSGPSAATAAARSSPPAATKTSRRAGSCERILEHREQGTPLTHQAVLFRAQHHSLALEMELSRRNIPFHKYGGLRFVEMAHVKDLVSFLRLAENPRDAMAGLRVLGLVPGIGPKTAAALARSAGGRRRRLRRVGERQGARARARRVAGRRRAAAQPRRRRRPATCPPRCTPCAASTALCSSAATTTRRRACATSSRSRRSRRARPTAPQFLADLVLDPPAYTQELAGPPLLDEDYLILSTMHSAKGLEFDVVYVMHAADGNIPSDMATGSSRRDRRGAAPLLRRLHAGPRPALRHPPAALLHAAVGQGRHARLRAALAVPERGGAARTSPRCRPRPSRPTPTASRSSARHRPRSAPASGRCGNRPTDTQPPHSPRGDFGSIMKGGSAQGVSSTHPPLPTASAPTVSLPTRPAISTLASTPEPGHAGAHVPARLSGRSTWR